MAVGELLDGPEPAGFQFNSLGIYATDINEAAGWNGTVAPTISKAGGIGVHAITNVGFYSSTSSSNTVRNAIFIYFTDDLAVSDPVSVDIVISLSGNPSDDVWRPDAISSFTLVWGVPATGPFQHGFGTFQSTALNPFQGVPDVPEPSTAIAMGLLGIVGFAGNRRRRRQGSVA